MSDFIHLHLHSEYSLLDGACRIKSIVSHAKELGQRAVAVTDHGCMYAAIDFYNEAMQQGIKPVIGCEVYVAPRTQGDKIHGIDNKPYHLILLCETNEGYSNLIKLVSSGYIDGFYNKPRIDLAVLKKYSKGLIALSACIAGEIPRKLLNGEYQAAKEAAVRYRDIMGEGNFFIEVQNHNIRDELSVLPLLYKLSRETGIPLVATNDVHYVQKEDAKIQRILLSIQTGTALSQPNPIAFPNNEFYMKSSAEMTELFRNNLTAVENTVLIAERCNVTFEFGKIKLPRYDIPGISDNSDYFRNMCYDGMRERYGCNPSDEIKSRMSYELDVIIKMGYVNYYLIVWDFIHYAKTHDIPVGPGRGSGAGSIAAYCIGITNIDPMKYNLLFERFLNPERVSMPDFDIDFCYEGRQRVIDYVVEKYGADRVAQIITFGTMAAKAAIKDVGRVMELPYQAVDTVSKLIPFELHITIDKALESSSELKKLYSSDAKIHELIDYAKKIEGMPRHVSTHAAGVVISDAAVSNYVPVQNGDGSIVTQYTMTALESLGLLKMDFLGLRTLTVINSCAKEIQKSIPEFDIEKIPLDDKSVFHMLSDGNSSAVFQFESAGMRAVLSRLKPEAIEDLIAVLSLYRPRPIDSIPKYIHNRHHPESVTYKHPMLKDILDVTYGCIVYQEQVMEICRKLAGYSYGRADLVRRAMAKKKADVMEKERSVFVDGAVKNGVSAVIADDIFNEMSSFASYAFNKSHAAAYAHVSYQTAYLKCHYYMQYMAALMTSVIENTGKVMEYISECKKNNIKILRPDINESMGGFTAAKDGIRFALLEIKNLGRSAIDEIVSERKTNGAFKSLSDFCERMSGKDVNRKAAECLIKSGAFDSFYMNRHEMLENYERIFSSLQSSVRQNIDGQINFFEAQASSSSSQNDVSIEKFPEYDLKTLLEYEKEAVGMYVSGHPLEQYLCFSEALKHIDISRIIDEDSELKDGTGVNMFCIVQGVKQHKTKKGADMAFLAVEDMSGEVEAIAFPEVFAINASRFIPGRIVYIESKLSCNDNSPKLIIERAMNPEQFVIGCREMNVYIRCSSTDNEKISMLLELCGQENNKGKGTLTLYFEDIKKYVKPRNIEGVTVSTELLDCLGNIFGVKNVALIR